MQSPYKNMNSCIKQSIKHQGIKGIFGGFSIAVLHTALSLSLIDPISSVIGKWYEINDSLKLLGSIAII